jgi:ferrous iron transport protein A
MKMDFLLQPNTVCRIISLGANPDVTKRLAQMGILPGTEVTIVRVGPFGDPFEIAVTHGQNIALRREEVESLDCEVIALPLTGASPGPATYRVRELQGGMGFQRKMADRGLAVGAKLRVQEGYPYRLYVLPDGPFSTVGRGEAEKVLLEPLEERGDHV